MSALELSEIKSGVQVTDGFEWMRVWSGRKRSEQQNQAARAQLRTRACLGRIGSCSDRQCMDERVKTAGATRLNCGASYSAAQRSALSRSLGRRHHRRHLQQQSIALPLQHTHSLCHLPSTSPHQLYPLLDCCLSPSRAVPSLHKRHLLPHQPWYALMPCHSFVVRAHTVPI